MLTEIHDLNDVAAFARQLVAEGTIFHPDDDFLNYTDLDTLQIAFTNGEGGLRNFLMRQCFTVCENANVDICDFTNEVFLIETGLDEFIPLPSALIINE